MLHTGQLEQYFYSGCVDKFCPAGKFCYERLGPCENPPCRPILMCLPNEVNGCRGHDCPFGEVCVERVQPCIGKSCRKIAICAKAGTCDAFVCPPSQKCVENPKPKCVKHVPTVSSVIGEAHLSGNHSVLLS
ncbi:unnamed protein product [Strongylus vulgaris]|uniref:Uncharacterized protein n=1 Tax=Strongylus vulgaris TaxID=40348 RepID=A0A3P7IJI1_STRVU|nr:unnamed protein product [Strongylus vulgaris]